MRTPITVFPPIDHPQPRARALPERVPHRQLLVRGHGGRVEHRDLHRVPRPVGVGDVGRASGSSTSSHASSAWSRPTSARATSSPTERAADRDGDRADHRPHDRARGTLERARARSPTSPAFRASRRSRAAEADTSGSASRRSPKRHPALPNYGAALGAGLVATVGPAGAGAARARRHRQRVHEPAAARSGSRDHAGAARGGRARPPGRAGARRARRHRDVTPFNAVGTGGSRSATLASGAVVGAAAGVARADRRALRRTARARPERRRGRRRHGRSRGVPASAWDLGPRRRARRRPSRSLADFAIPDGGWTQADALLLGRGRRRHRPGRASRATSWSRTAAR